MILLENLLKVDKRKFSVTFYNIFFSLQLGLEKLDKLELNHNKIDQLVNYSFEGLPKLTSLSIDYNKIRIVEAMAFNGLDGNFQ